MTTPAVAPSTVTLIDLIKAFVQHCTDQGKDGFPSFLHYPEPWHRFLYELAESKAHFPLVECIGEFDWDGRYPTCRNWREVQSSFCITEFCISYGVDRSHFNEETRRPINQLAIDHPELFALMLRTGESIPQFFES
jgi:hypothetical protein